MKRYFRDKLRTYCDVCKSIVPVSEEGRLFKDGDDVLDVCSAKCAEREFNARYQPAFYFISGDTHINPSSNTGVNVDSTAKKDCLFSSCQDNPSHCMGGCS